MTAAPHDPADALLEKLTRMADRHGRHSFGLGDYWNAVGEARDRIAADAKRIGVLVKGSHRRDDRIAALEKELIPPTPASVVIERARARIAALESQVTEASRLAAPLAKDVQELIGYLREEHWLGAADLIERLARKNAELEADASRWRKLLELGVCYDDCTGFINQYQRARIWFHECADFKHTTLTEYIDAALAAGGEPLEQGLEAVRLDREHTRRAALGEAAKVCEQRDAHCVRIAKLEDALRDLIAYGDKHNWGYMPEGATIDKARAALAAGDGR